MDVTEYLQILQSVIPPLCLCLTLVPTLPYLLFPSSHFHLLSLYAALSLPLSSDTALMSQMSALACSHSGRVMCSPSLNGSSMPFPLSPLSLPFLPLPPFSPSSFSFLLSRSLDRSLFPPQFRPQLFPAPTPAFPWRGPPPLARPPSIPRHGGEPADATQHPLLHRQGEVMRCLTSSPECVCVFELILCLCLCVYLWVPLCV